MAISFITSQDLEFLAEELVYVQIFKKPKEARKVWLIQVISAAAAVVSRVLLSEAELGEVLIDELLGLLWSGHSSEDRLRT